LPKGEKVQGLIFHSQISVFLAIHAKGGEGISLKQKDRTTINFKNIQFVFKKFFHLVSYF
jgi:hypothetical protein